MSYPLTRTRRIRQSQWLRDLVAEHSLSVSDLVWPIFIKEGHNIKEEVKTMPGVFRFSIDELVNKVKHAQSLGIRAIALFPSIEPEHKTLLAAESYNPNNLVCRAIKKLRDAGITIGISCDVALDPYTTHGHDGILSGTDVNNDVTVGILCKQALNQAKAGCDIVAPSDMMDGRILRIRETLEENNFHNTAILSHAAKYTSAFYGPFRDAVNSKTCLGHGSKSSYQMDPRNAKEAMHNILMDIDEGADMIMVKPGMPYLDIVKEASQICTVPIFVYQISGEYSMIRIASINGAIEYKTAMLESLLCFKRAGAQAIFTYAAIDVAQWLGNM